MAKRGGAARSSVSRGDAEFFKVFLPELHSHQLMIPPDYMKHFNRTIRERVMLKDVDGIIWYVTVEKTENGVFLKNGWPSFVNRHLLSLGEFLVFKYDKGFSFLVKIYSINGCKKEIFAANNNTARVKVKENTKEEMNATHTLGKRASPRNNETGVSLDSSECSFFVSHLAHGKQYQLEIPKGVGQNVHLESQMALRDAKGKEWDVHITTSNDGRVYIGRGYSQFRIDNNLGPKDGCKFTFGAEKSSGFTKDVKLLEEFCEIAKRRCKRRKGTSNPPDLRFPLPPPPCSRSTDPPTKCRPPSFVAWQGGCSSAAAESG